MNSSSIAELRSKQGRKEALDSGGGIILKGKLCNLPFGIVIICNYFPNIPTETNNLIICINVPSHPGILLKMEYIHYSSVRTYCIFMQFINTELILNSLVTI